MNFVKRSWGEMHSEVFGYKFLFVKKTKFLFSSSSSTKRQLHEMNERATNNCCFPELKPPKKNPSRVPLCSVLHCTGVCAAITWSFINRDMSLSLQLFGHFFIQNEGRWQCPPSQQFLQPLAEGGRWRLNNSTVFTRVSQEGIILKMNHWNWKQCVHCAKWFYMQADKTGGTANSRFPV